MVHAPSSYSKRISSSSTWKQSAIRRTASSKTLVYFSSIPGTAGSSIDRPKPTSTQVSTEWWHDTSTDSTHRTCSISVTSVEWTIVRICARPGFIPVP